MTTPRQQFEATSDICFIVCLGKDSTATRHNRIGRKDECAGSGLRCPLGFFSRQTLRKIRRLFISSRRFIDLGRAYFVWNKTNLE